MVGIGWKRFDRLSWATVGKIEGAMQRISSSVWLSLWRKRHVVVKS